MTSRRGFIQGIFASVAALVLPKTAQAVTDDEPSVKLEHGIAIDGMDSCPWPDTLEFEPVFVIPTYSPGDRLYYSEYLFLDEDGASHITAEIGDFTKHSLSEMCDDYYACGVEEI